MLYVGSFCTLFRRASRIEEWFSVPLKMDEMPQMELAAFTRRIQWRKYFMIRSHRTFSYGSPSQKTRTTSFTSQVIAKLSLFISSGAIIENVPINSPSAQLTVIVFTLWPMPDIEGFEHIFEISKLILIKNKKNKLGKKYFPI